MSQAKRSVRSLFFLVLSVTAARADVRLPRILSSHMVVQRDRPLHLWGWAEPGETVGASLNGASQSASADRLGNWSLYLPSQPAGGPFSIAINGKNKLVLEDILIGDVWFASGQSNMEMPLSGFGPGTLIKNGTEEISRADNPRLRLFLVERRTAPYPMKDVESKAAWTTCTPRTAAGFSAVAYFFGRQIADSEQVPVGLIDSTWGGTLAESWISLDTLSSDASLMPVFAARAVMLDQQADVAALEAADKRDDEDAKEAGRPPAEHPWHPDSPSWEPTWLFNGMVAPILPLAIKGAIWYQGESNSEAMRAPLYEKVFSSMITDWREHWQQGNFPFLFVQISSYNAGKTATFPVVRDAQRRTLKLANTAMAVTTDVGNPDNVHPADKQTVGARLALAAGALAYGKNIEYSGPLFVQAAPESSDIRVLFTHDAGLNAKGGALKGFEVAGEDLRFAAAQARIEGGAVICSSPDVSRPKYVRYAWANVPDANLYNGAGLPASPFTSQRTLPVF